MFLLLFSAFLAQAAFRDPGSEPGPRSLCRRSEMNACIEEHRRGMNQELASIAAIDEKLGLSSKDQSALRQEQISLENEARKASITAEMAAREARYSDSLSSGGPLFTGGPAPEEIFFLKGRSNFWEELHFAERRARLNTLVDSSLEARQRIEPLRRNLAMEIQALESLDATIKQERVRHGQQVNVHADMCNSGCKMRFCRED